MRVGDRTVRPGRVSRIRTISLQLQRTVEDVKLLRGHRTTRVRGQFQSGLMEMTIAMTTVIAPKMRSLAGMATQTSLSARQK